MKNNKLIKEEALATVNAALTMLEQFNGEALTSGDSTLSLNFSSNPFQLFMDFFKSTVGYDKFINIISKFIVIELPVIEQAVKVVMLTSIKNIISCTFNPFISDNMLRNGFLFDFRQLDLKGILNYCPLSQNDNETEVPQEDNKKKKRRQKNPGKYFYFGCDDFNTPDDLVKATDFDAFLWYIKNRASTRYAWLGYKHAGENPKQILPNHEYTKNDGIITLEYVERPTSLKNSVGGAMYSQNANYDMLHVFMGNTCFVDFDPDNLTWTISSCSNKINRYDELLVEIDNIIEQLDEVVSYPSTYGNMGGSFADREALMEFRNAVAGDASTSSLSIVYSNPNTIWSSYVTPPGDSAVYYIPSINESIFIDTDLWNSNRSVEIVSKNNAQNALNICCDNPQPSSYPLLEQNHYYRKSLLEFDTDYIWSLKLFDSKVITAQLIDAMTSCLTIDLGLSVNQQIIKAETESMVQRISESDDIVINDCFFSFTNDQYNDMLEKAELNRMGIGNTSTNLPNDFDATSLLDMLNGMSDDATEEEKIKIVESCIETLSGVVNSYLVDTELYNVGAYARMGFLENLLSNLAYVVVSSVISPKLYLMIAINMQLMGQNSDFSIQGFIEANKQMMVNIIRSIRDEILKYLQKELMNIVDGIVKSMADKMLLEQFGYYRTLLQKCIECFQLHGRSFDWNMANVDYADIEAGETEEIPANATC